MLGLSCSISALDGLWVGVVLCFCGMMGFLQGFNFSDVHLCRGVSWFPYVEVLLLQTEKVRAGRGQTPPCSFLKTGHSRCIPLPTASPALLHGGNGQWPREKREETRVSDWRARDVRDERSG